MNTVMESCEYAAVRAVHDRGGTPAEARHLLELHPDTYDPDTLTAAVEDVFPRPVLAPAAGTVRPYSTRTWGELLRMSIPPLTWWWGRVFALCRLHAMFGQGGLGKSRIAINLARNQVLGLPFGGIPTGGGPLRHLLLGSENSIHRLQYDAQRQSSGLTPEQLRLLAEHIFLATLENPEDPFLSLADPSNVERWKATLAHRKPQVLWVDPWGDIQVGDANADEDARETVSILMRLARQVDPTMAVVVLAHARTGAKNILQATGYEGANFGKGSKALFSAARCVVNMAPGDESENPAVIMANAKNNDAPRQPPFALRLDPETMLYNEDPDFDFEQWQTDVANTANGKRKVKRKTLSEVDAVALVGGETDTTLGMRKRLQAAGATRDDADDLIKRIVAARTWVQWRPNHKNAPTFIGNPGAIKARRKAMTEGQQGELQA